MPGPSLGATALQCCCMHDPLRSPCAPGCPTIHSTRLVLSLPAACNLLRRGRSTGCAIKARWSCRYGSSRHLNSGPSLLPPPAPISPPPLAPPSHAPPAGCCRRGRGGDVSASRARAARGTSETTECGRAGRANGLRRSVTHAPAPHTPSDPLPLPFSSGPPLSTLTLPLLATAPLLFHQHGHGYSALGLLHAAITRT